MRLAIATQAQTERAVAAERKLRADQEATIRSLEDGALRAFSTPEASHPEQENGTSAEHERTVRRLEEENFRLQAVLSLGLLCGVGWLGRYCNRMIIRS